MTQIAYMEDIAIKDQFALLIRHLQNDICAALEEVDGAATFTEEHWHREGGGGGRTRVISNGDVFEKGGVNTSVVYGQVTDTMRNHLKINGDSWYACGISSVIHPVNPFVPTIHFNYRMFELYDEAGEVIDRWFGGGTDLTPFYLYEEDAVHFHKTFKNVCDDFDTSFYRMFKSECDDYFTNHHRNGERRGIGGIFYDHRREIDGKDAKFWLEFAKHAGYAFIEAYIPIVKKRKKAAFNPENKFWQEIRRGRYIEFNLVHDRGTLFGLKTNGRTESILMSLPPTARFEYSYEPEPGSDEDRLYQACLHPRDWV